MKRSRIVGTGSFVPSRVVDNEEVATPLGLEPNQIVALTGIRTRHWAEEGQASSDLAVVAGQRACEAAGLAPESIEAIVVSTTSPDSAFPSTACHVQRAVMAFDLSASCSGFLYGLSMADVMIRSGQIRSCLVIASEIKSRSLNILDKETAILFGDGAGAVVVASEDSMRKARATASSRFRPGGHASPAAWRRYVPRNICYGCEAALCFDRRCAGWNKPSPNCSRSLASRSVMWHMSSPIRPMHGFWSSFGAVSDSHTRCCTRLLSAMEIPHRPPCLLRWIMPCGIGVSQQGISSCWAHSAAA